MKQLFIYLWLVLVLLSIPACGKQSPTAIPTPTQDPATPAAETQIAAGTQMMINATAAQKAAATAILKTQQTRATRTAAVQQTQARETADVQSTQMALVQATATSQGELLATQTAQPMQALVESLAKDGLIENSAGTYYHIPTFDESWAQLNWYRWWETGYNPKNFVIHTQTSWWSASRTADWWVSGCGFVFHETDAKNHYFINLALDGVVSLHKVVNGYFIPLASNTYGKVNIPDGSAEIALVVDNDWITFFVNGKKVLSDQDSSLASGDLALSLISGTNKDYGTRCQMKDIDLWILQ